MKNRKKASPLKEGRTIVIVGGPGTGKSSVINRLVSVLYSEQYRDIVLMDPTTDLQKGIESRWNLESSIEPRDCIVIKRDHEEATRFFMSPPSWWEFREKKKLCFLQSNSSKQIADTIVSLGSSEFGTGKVLVCDEAELLFQGQSRAHGEAMDLVTRVRNRKQTLILACKRPQDIPVQVRGNAHCVLWFRTPSREVVDYGSKEFGSSEQFERAKSLEKFRYLFKHCQQSHEETLREYDCRVGNELPKNILD